MAELIGPDRSSNSGVPSSNLIKAQLNLDPTTPTTVDQVQSDILKTTVDAFETKAPATPTKAATSRYAVNDPTDTVEGRIGGLLDSDSDYMKRAQASGLQSANARGLLNSTMGVQAGEAVAMDKAFQIASQDAGTYAQAGMKNAELSNQMNQANLTAENQRYVSDSGIQANFALTDQNALNTARQTAAEHANTMEKTQYETQAGLTKTGMEIQGAMDRVQYDATATKDRLLIENAAKIEQLGMDIKGEMDRLTAENAAELQQLMVNIDERYTEAFAASYTPMNQQYMTDWVKIATSPDYANPADKQADLDALSYSFKANTETLGALFGFEISMGSMTDAFETAPATTAPATTTTAPATTTTAPATTAPATTAPATTAPATTTTTTGIPKTGLLSEMTNGIPSDIYNSGEWDNVTTTPGAGLTYIGTYGGKPWYGEPAY